MNSSTPDCCRLQKHVSPWSRGRRQCPSPIPVKCWPIRYPSSGRVAVTLVNETSVIPYSAMVPAHIAGNYAADEITIDLVRLCQAVKVRFVAEKVTALDPSHRQVRFAGRPPLSYDALSLGLGSVPACPSGVPSIPNAASFYDRSQRSCGNWQSWKKDCGILRKTIPSGHRRGQGASGCELALAIHSTARPISRLFA